MYTSVQIMACHELGLAHLGSIFCFWQIGVLLRSHLRCRFCTFYCLCGRDFCMMCTHTCADVHGLAWHRKSDVAREPFLSFEHELCKSHMLSDGVFFFFIYEIGALPATFARMMSIAHTPGSLHIQCPMRCQWAAIVVCFLRISLWPLMYWLMSFLEISTRV